MGPPTFSPSGPVGSCLLSSFFLWLQALRFLGDFFCSATAVPAAPHWCSSTLSCYRFFFTAQFLESALSSCLFCSCPIRSHSGRSAPTNLVNPPCCRTSGLRPGCAPLLAASWPCWVFSVPPPLPSRLLTPVTPVLRSWGVSLVSQGSPFPVFDSLWLLPSCFLSLPTFFFPQNGNSLTRIK